MRAVLALSALVAAVLGGCGATTPTYPSVADPAAPWVAIARTLPDRADPASPHACGRGERSCIDAVSAEMRRRLDAQAARCEHGAAFALMYLRVTEAVSDSGAPASAGTAYLNHLDALFARQYFDAFDAWRAGRRSAVPQAWRIAFEAADRREVAGIGDMLLGMNAHISRDLPFALYAAGLRTPDGGSGQPAFDGVNDLLSEVQGPLLREEARRFDPTIARATLPLALGAAPTVADLIARWRTEAFANARRLLDAPGAAARASVAREIERAAAGRARALAALTSSLVIGPGTEARDRYCRAQRSAARA